MPDAARRVVRIGCARAALFRWIKAEAVPWQIHTLEPPIPDRYSRLILRRQFGIILVRDIARIHRQHLRRGLLNAAKRIFARALDQELEGPLQSGERTQF